MQRGRSQAGAAAADEAKRRRRVPRVVLLSPRQQDLRQQIIYALSVFLIIFWNVRIMLTLSSS